MERFQPTRRKSQDDRERPLRLALDSLPTLVAYLDLRRRHVFCNRPYARWFGAAPEDVPGRPIEAVVGDANHAVLRPRLEEAFSGRAATQDLKLVRSDGTARWMQTTFTPHVAGAGGVQGVLVALEDATDRKLAQEAARASEERSRLILEGALDAVVLMDKEGAITGWNPQAEKIFGWTREEVLGTPMRSHIIPPSLREAHERGLARYLSTGRPRILGQRVEMPALRKDGSQFPAELTIVPIGSRPDISFCGFLRDITNQKRAEQRIHIQYQVARILSEAETFEEAAPRLLETICTTLGWAAGIAWLVDDSAGILRSSIVWKAPQATFEAMRQASMALTLSRGAGIPGKVWESGKVHWSEDARLEPGFLRKAELLQDDLRADITFPVLLGTQVLGVLEFFCHQRRPIDEAIIHLMDAIGHQIGQFLERKRAELAVRRSEERFRSLTETVPEILFTNQPSGALEYASSRFYAYTGMAPDAALGRGWLAAVHPDDRPRVQDSWQDSLRSGKPVDMQYRLRRFDGAYRWFMGRSIPTYDLSGRASRWFGALTDIHDQKRAQDSARFLAQASAILGSSLDYEKTLANLTRLAVPAMADWCSVCLLEAGTLRQLTLAHKDPRQLQLARELMERYPLEAEAEHGPHQVLRTGASVFLPRIADEQFVRAARDAEHLKLLRALRIHSYLCVPLRARDQILGTLTFVKAESREEYTPEDLALAEELAHRAAIAIDNARLFHESQEAVRARSEFLSIASHELKTPLTTLHLQLQGLQRMIRREGDLPQDSAQAMLQEAELRATQLGHLINDLLDLSRMTVGKLSLETETVDLARSVQAVVERFREATHQSGSALQLDLREGVVGRWDRLRIEQMIGNLLSNALKYGRGRPIRISVAAAEREAILTVEDQGIGIEKRDLQRIFSAFERAVSSRNYSGWGLGLHIVRQIVEAHGGVVTAHSVPDVGSRFVVKLPL